MNQLTLSRNNESGEILFPRIFQGQSMRQERWAYRKEADSLTERAAHGDLAAFNQLVLAYQDQVYNQAYWMLGQEDAAEDATQEAFLQAFRHLHTFHGGSFRAWLMKIAVNQCLDQLRLQKARPACSLETYNEYDEEIESSSWLADPNEGPDRVVEQDLTSDRIADCIQRLSPEYRSVLILVDLQELDYQEAASSLRIPLGTVKSRLARARLQMRGMLRMSTVN
jgi:RNA polymerase sigma-70 factor (ECF subfamily)